VLLASLKTAVDSKTFLISANAGPSQLAGELCSPYVFSTSWQNDQTPQAMGLYMNQKGVKSVFLIGPNYAAGKDMLAGVKSTFKGRWSARNMTVWPSQLDFSAELSKARASKPRRSSCSIPARPACSSSINMRRPASRADPALHRLHHRRIVAAAAEGERARRSRRAAMGQRSAERENKKFVADYRKKYKACARPSTARSPMTPRNLINSAVVAVKGDTSKKDAMKRRDGEGQLQVGARPFKYGNNHIPIQNFYLQDVVKDADGSSRSRPSPPSSRTARIASTTNAR
jgi:branched-chain amino acid transport system substrate-binding protein